MDDQPKRRRSEYQSYAVAITVNGVTTVHVHGSGGPLTMVELTRKRSAGKMIPSAAILMAHPDDSIVAWDGEQFITCESMVDVIEDSRLEFVARIIDVTGTPHAALYGHEPTEVDRRLQLLREYKEATGNPSNRQIYEAQNSGIYKPEFYKWRDGRLSADSSTTINFERFLKAKKPPVRDSR